MRNKIQWHLRLVLYVFILNIGQHSIANNRVLVWSDEFEAGTIDLSTWTFDFGSSNDNVHYYTDRLENAKIKDGILQIIAQKENYQGYNYTSASLTTKKSMSWKYGRFEASIKLPASNGFVPAFWMLPADNVYSWWPNSGEIDIMEHPTNQVENIYGTVHTEAYNLFDGDDLPQGDLTAIPDAESVFHVYAIEWTPEKIDFYVDDQMYYSFENDGNGNRTWPFDQPFYLILNLAVGGGWVGDPTLETLFPAVMEVDYVRVYQYPEDITINGPDFPTAEEEPVSYSLPEIEGFTYNWSVPNKAEIVSGRNTPVVEVDWGIFGGNIEVETGSSLLEYSVQISSNILKNGNFEKGVKYWKNAVAYPVDASIKLIQTDKKNGKNSVFAEVRSVGANSWDVQLSQTDIELEKGKQYSVSFWGKSETESGDFTVSVINKENFTLYQQKIISTTNSWKQYTFDFNAPENAISSFNIDMGGNTGQYYFDDISLIPSETGPVNQVQNADFSRESEYWTITAYSPAKASGEVISGAYYVSIDDIGNYPWDINLGQGGIQLEQSQKYSISFDARALAERKISAFAGLNKEPWTVYGEKEFKLSTRRQTFEFEFTMDNPSDTGARVAFDLGGDVANVVVDNVFLSRLDAPSTVTNNYGGTNEFLQCYPNPVQHFTDIKFSLSQGTHATLEIINTQGAILEVLVNEFMDSGLHTIRWTVNKNIKNGIYFVRLTTDDPTMFYIRKMSIIL